MHLLWPSSQARALGLPKLAVLPAAQRVEDGLCTFSGSTLSNTMGGDQSLELVFDALHTSQLERRMDDGLGYIILNQVVLEKASPLTRLTDCKWLQSFQ